MHSIWSIIDEAYALQEAHVQLWSSRTAPRHPHGTRAEKKRITTAIKERDIAFVSHYLERQRIMNCVIERTRASIIVFTYLTDLQYLLQFENFRNTVWAKMNELETIAGQKLEALHRITGRKEFEEQEQLCEYLHALFHAIWHLRAAIRK
jgi:hypothetical protein